MTWYNNSFFAEDNKGVKSMDIQESLNRLSMHIATEEDRHLIECLKRHVSYMIPPPEILNSGISNQKKYICIDGVPVYEINISSFGAVSGKHL
jgi:hypothetical protein